MTWHVDGTGKDLSFVLDSEGHWIIRGHGRHRCHPGGGDYDFLAAVEAIAEMTWSLYSPSTLQNHVDTVTPGLWTKFQQTPSAPPAAITYMFDAKPIAALLTAQAILSTEIAPIVYDMFKSIRGTDAKYRLLFDFWGLRVPEANADVPSVAEFMNANTLKRRPYFSEAFTVIFPDQDLPQ